MATVIFLVLLCLCARTHAHTYTYTAPNDTCLVEPQDPACMDYIIPPAMVVPLIGGLCGMMSSMPGCTVDKYCHEAKYAKDMYCAPFTTYKELCTDMAKMSNCSTYTTMCGANSTIRECGVATILPTSKQTTSNIQSMCAQMPMDGCSQCGFSQYGEEEALYNMEAMATCELLQVYSDMCLSMPGMPQCEQWKQMCTAIPNWPLCKSKGSSNIPIMRMYFHTGILDYVLFKQWVPDTTGKYVISWFAIFVFAAFLEIFKMYRSRAEKQWKAEVENPETELLLNASVDVPNKGPLFSVRREFSRASLHFIEVGWGLLVMLVAMTFNVGLFLAVCAGAFFGMLIVGRYIHYVPKASCH